MDEAGEIDWDVDVIADPAESYQSLVRSLQRTDGFSLFFVRCVPGDQPDLVHRLQADLPTLHMQRLELESELVDGNLYQRVATLPDFQQINVLFISGIEKSLDPYVKSGYGGQGDYYKLDTVPRVLGHLNLQRERFRDDFPFCLVFFLSAFGIKYIARRAPDFFDWRSGIFEFIPDSETVGKLTEELQGDYDKYLTWSHTQRLDQIREIQAILEEDQQTANQQANLWWEKGNILAADQNYEAAIASYDKAIEIQPDKHEAWHNRGTALSDLGQKEAALAKLSEGLASYDKALAFKPDLHEAWYNRGIALSDLGQKEAAIASYDRAIELKPDKHEAWYNRGNALCALGQKEVAIASYDKALAFKPDLHEAWGNRGLALSDLGQKEAAIASYDKAIELKSDLHGAWYSRGNALSNLGSYEKAIANYDQALTFKPDYHAAWNNRGNALSNLGRYEEAITSYDKALASKPYLHQAWGNRGTALTALGHYEEALVSYNRVLEIKPDGNYAIYKKAACYSLQGAIQKAIETLQHAIALNSRYRDMAKTDSDFDGIRDDERFQAMVGE